MTNVPGSSRYFRGGIVSYATEVKELMGVDPARHPRARRDQRRDRGRDGDGGARTSAGGRRASASPASPARIRRTGKPVGEVHIAVDLGDGRRRVVSYTMAQSREQVKRRAVTQAISLLRRSLV